MCHPRGEGRTAPAHPRHAGAARGGLLLLLAGAVIGANCTDTSTGRVRRRHHPTAVYTAWRRPPGADPEIESYDVLHVGKRLVWVTVQPQRPSSPVPGQSSGPLRPHVWSSGDGRRWTSAGAAGFDRFAGTHFTPSVVGTNIFITGELDAENGRREMAISRSTDGGRTWQLTTLRSPRIAQGETAMVAAVGRRLVLFGSVMFTGRDVGAGHPRLAGWTSTDQGRTWRLLSPSTFDIVAEDAPRSTARTPEGDLVVFAQSGRAWASSDGRGWAEIHGPKDWPADLLFSLQDGRLGARTFASTDIRDVRWYWSDDLGRTWGRLRAAGVRVGRGEALTAEPERMTRTGRTLWMEAPGETSDDFYPTLQRSDDHGRSWKDTGIRPTRCSSLRICPNTTIHAPTDVDGVLVTAVTCRYGRCGRLSSFVLTSVDGGRRWHRLRLPRRAAEGALLDPRIVGRTITYEVRAPGRSRPGRPAQQGLLVIRP